MTQQLQHAIEQMELARARYIAAKTKKGMREAADDLEFWSNKASMLQVMVERL